MKIQTEAVLLKRLRNLHSRIRASITEARAARRADAEGVSQENTEGNTRPFDITDVLCFPSVFSCEAGRYTAGQLDAAPYLRDVRRGPPGLLISCSFFVFCPCLSVFASLR